MIDALLFFILKLRGHTDIPMTTMLTPGMPTLDMDIRDMATKDMLTKDMLTKDMPTRDMLHRDMLTSHMPTSHMPTRGIQAAQASINFIWFWYTNKHLHEI